MYNRIKRFIDFLISLIILPILLLLIIIVGIAIKLDDGGPVLFWRKNRISWENI